jgi:hypothetical protein
MRTYRAIASALPISLLWLSLTGCTSRDREPSLDDILEENRAALTAKVASIRAIVDQIESLPPLERDGFSEVPDPLPDFRQLDRSSHRDAAPIHNARAIHLTRLQVASGEASEHTRAGNTPSWWLSSVDALEAGALEGYQVRGLREILQVDYVLVFRPQREVAPVVTGDDTFEPGLFEGEALLFEVDGETFLGGVRVAASNQDEIRFTRGRAEQSVVDHDLGYQVNRVTSELLEAHLPEMGPAFDTDGSPMTVYVGRTGS